MLCVCAHVSNWWSKFSQFSYISVNSVFKLNIVCKKKLLCFNWFYKMEFLFVLQTKKFFLYFLFTCVIMYCFMFCQILFHSYLNYLFRFTTFVHIYMLLWMFWGLHIYVRIILNPNYFSFISGHIFLKRNSWCLTEKHHHF